MRAENDLEVLLLESSTASLAETPADEIAE
jgi:hypothetical protein